MFCYKCGTQFQGNFCPNCGAPADTSKIKHPTQPVGSSKAYPFETKNAAPPKKKRGGCLIPVLVVFAVIILFAMSLRKESDNADSKTNNQVASDVEPTDSHSETETENSDEDIKEVGDGLTIDKNVIYDDRSIVISVDDVSKNSSSITVSFIVQNNSENDYSIAAHAWDVNGIMMGDGQYGFNTVESAAGKKTRVDLKMKKNTFEEYGISTISEIDVLFWIYSDSFKEWDTGLLNVKTNQYDEKLRVKIDKGPDYSDDIVDVWYAGRDDKNNYSFYVLNKSNYNASCTIENCYINDWSYELTDYTYDAFNEIVNSNAYILITIPIDKEFTEMNGITEVESIGFNVLLDDDNWGHQGELWKHHTDKIVFSNIGLP